MPTISEAIASVPPPRPPAKTKPLDQVQAFYRSWQWAKLRYQVLKERGVKCECCGAIRSNEVRIVVDHIKPIRYFWHLRLDKANCQVFCDACNRGKGSDDVTDWRAPDDANEKEQQHDD